MTSKIKVVHQGRGGYVELDGKRYDIEMFASGFAIHFPCGHRHSKLQDDVDQLEEFASQRDPVWCVENRSRKYKQ